MRKRATAVIIRGGKVLLVRDRGNTKFLLPGGAIENGESVADAVKRELYEELKLNTTKVTRLRERDYKSPVNEHKVCRVEVEGEPQASHEIDKFIWCDIKEPITIAVFSHVNNILKEIQE